MFDLGPKGTCVNDTYAPMQRDRGNRSLYPQDLMDRFQYPLAGPHLLGLADTARSSESNDLRPYGRCFDVVVQWCSRAIHCHVYQVTSNRFIALGISSEPRRPLGGQETVQGWFQSNQVPFFRLSENVKDAARQHIPSGVLCQREVGRRCCTDMGKVLYTPGRWLRVCSGRVGKERLLRTSLSALIVSTEGAGSNAEGSLEK